MRPDTELLEFFHDGEIRSLKAEVAVPFGSDRALVLDRLFRVQDRAATVLDGRLVYVTVPWKGEAPEPGLVSYKLAIWFG